LIFHVAMRLVKCTGRVGPSGPTLPSGLAAEACPAGARCAHPRPRPRSPSPLIHCVKVLLPPPALLDKTARHTARLSLQPLRSVADLLFSCENAVS
jgi:hypothetical protein